MAFYLCSPDHLYSFKLFTSQTSRCNSLLVFSTSPNPFGLFPLSKPAPPSLASPTHFTSMLFTSTSRWLAKILNDWQPAQRGHYLWDWWLGLCFSQSGKSSRDGQVWKVPSCRGKIQRKLHILMCSHFQWTGALGLSSHHHAESLWALGKTQAVVFSVGGKRTWRRELGDSATLRQWFLCSPKWGENEGGN